MTLSEIKPPARTPVMADVARLAGVSHQTVSRVINGQNNLRPATRERVEQANTCTRSDISHTLAP